MRSYAIVFIIRKDGFRCAPDFASTLRHLFSVRKLHNLRPKTLYYKKLIMNLNSLNQMLSLKREIFYFFGKYFSIRFRASS
jgi:DNA-binding transcriptional regulator GbsR (MarR family)